MRSCRLTLPAHALPWRARSAREAPASHRAEAARECHAPVHLVALDSQQTEDPRGRAEERPRPRDRSGDVIPVALPVAATTLARAIAGADVPAPNVLSARHLNRIAGGLLYAATSNVPWATLLARTFEVDVKSCVRCGGRLEVRAVVTDLDTARQILDAMPATARAPPTSAESRASSTNPRSRKRPRADGALRLAHDICPRLLANSSRTTAPSGKRSPERAAPTRYDFLRSISLPIHEKSSRGVRCPPPESPVPLPTTGAVANGSVGAGGETIQGLICRPVVP